MKAVILASGLGARLSKRLPRGGLSEVSVSTARHCLDWSLRLLLQTPLALVNEKHKICTYVYEIPAFSAKQIT